MKRKVILTGYLDSETHANDYYIEYLTLNDSNLVKLLDEAEFDYPAKVTITFEVEEK